MPCQPPFLIAIDHDSHHAKHVGKLKDGRQFFLTNPFEPGGNEFVALFIFDSSGLFLEAMIEDFGPREWMDEAKANARYQAYLGGLGEVFFTRIDVQPVSIERFGIDFGLILQEREEENEPWVVEMHPGNYMAFYEPWDSGMYDT